MKPVKKNGTTTFKYNDLDDNKIYDVLENRVIDKSQFIKNALYYYIIMIEKGNIIDRNLPIETNSNMDNIHQLLDLINHQKNTVPIEYETTETVENHEESGEEESREVAEEFEVPEELLNVEEDDYNF